MICPHQFADKPACCGAAPPAEIGRYLERRARDYFGDDFARRADVLLVGERKRVNSQLMEFAIQGEGAPRRVFVKRTLSPAHPQSDGAPRGVDWLMRYPRTDPALKHLYEHRALVAIYDRFGAHRGDDRFDAIRPLDLLPDPYALVMEKCEGGCLDAIWRRANRLQYPFLTADVEMLMQRAGDWLRAFHRLEPLEHTRPRNTGRHDFEEAVERFATYLATRGPAERCFGEFSARLARAASEILPPQLPLGLCHIDFGPRNLLVGAGGRLTGFDSQGRWLAPIYEDLARFLIAFKASYAQMWSGGRLYDRALLERCENAFLAGYFAGDDVPLRAIRLFECLLLLERMTGAVYRRQVASGWRRVAKGWRLALWRRYCKTQFRRTFDELEAFS